LTNVLSCNLKFYEKVFHLNQAIGTSCCRAHSLDLKNYSSINQLLDHWHNEHLDLLQNRAITSCEICWKDEEKNLTSHRLLEGQNEPENHVRLVFSNACNQMCSYCSPKYSSTWQNDIAKNGMFNNISITSKQNLDYYASDIDQQYWINEVNNYISAQPDESVVLTLLGGEPLMQVTNLKAFINMNSAKIKKMIVITNLNPPDNKFLLWLLDNVSNSKLSFGVSIDATPEFNHIPRAKFDQDVFLQNLQILQLRQYQFKFLATCSVLNFFGLPNYLKWIQKNNFNVTFSKLSNPDCLNSSYIPIQFALPVIQQLKNYDVPKFVTELQHSNSLVDLKLREQYNYLTQYFSRTNTDTNTTNVEFNQYWTWLEERFK